MAGRISRLAAGMSRGIAVKGLDSAGGVQTASPSNSQFLIDGAVVVLQGDLVQPHGKSPHSSASMVEGSSGFTVNGVPVCLEGHKASCGHATTGRPAFKVSG